MFSYVLGLFNFYYRKCRNQFRLDSWGYSMLDGGGGLLDRTCVIETSLIGQEIQILLWYSSFKGICKLQIASSKLSSPSYYYYYYYTHLALDTVTIYHIQLTVYAEIYRTQCRWMTYNSGNIIECNISVWCLLLKRKVSAVYIYRYHVTSYILYIICTYTVYTIQSSVYPRSR